MAVLPRTVGELRKYLETFPDDTKIQLAQEGSEDLESFTFVRYNDSLVIVPAGIVLPDNVVSIYNHMDPNASWNLPK